MLSKKKIFDNIYIDPETECWIWQGKLAGEGAPAVYYDQGWEHARYLSYFTFIKDLSGQLYLKCKNRMCVNPDHMYIDYGKYEHYELKENMYVSITNIMKIKKLDAYGKAFSFRDMAMNTGVPIHIVAMVVQKRLWRDIEKYDTKPFDIGTILKK
jgi:hypothetical protein